MAIADVIAASGTSAGSIYHHFKSRHELVLAVAKGRWSVRWNRH
ncbi:MAG: TetR family transcriptional regulator [Micropruina sp.]|nr:TetR family transcriptional regulator [Micropruina sp.]